MVLRNNSPYFWRRFIAAVAVIAVAMTWSGHMAAQSVSSLRDQINANTVTVLSGNANGTYLYIAQDISFVLDDGDDVRILPVVGKGGAQNIRDLLFLRGIDMAIVSSDALGEVANQPQYGNVSAQLRYITKLYNEEMHIMTRKEITSIEQLNGKKVNFSDAGSGTERTAGIVFDALGVRPDKVNMSQKDGFEQLKAGQIDATILVAGKPSGAWRNLQIDMSQFHFLPVPWAEPLRERYFPTKFTHEDYPQLLGDGESVDTIAASAILAVYNWEPGTDRYQRVERFVDKFFSNIDKFSGPARHPKWRETNLTAELGGWTRFEPARKWLETHKSSDPTALRDQFQRFLNEQARGIQLNTEQQEAMFRLFLDWQKSQRTN